MDIERIRRWPLAYEPHGRRLCRLGSAPPATLGLRTYCPRHCRLRRPGSTPPVPPSTHRPPIAACAFQAERRQSCVPPVSSASHTPIVCPTAAASTRRRFISDFLPGDWHVTLHICATVIWPS
ncbi:hypothetical protein DAI22_01g081300 [Oryza sativa Japonica Group]|nr:hypothetical protein DAI22_01g081300 [Oryza sativa Japonica Group]